MLSLKIKLAGILIALLLGGFGWFAVKAGLGILERLDRAEENVRALQQASKAADRVLQAQDSLEKTVRSSRNARNRELEANSHSDNPAATADLLRLLKEDAAARRDRAAARAAGTVSGTGRQLQGP